MPNIARKRVPIGSGHGNSTGNAFFAEKKLHVAAYASSLGALLYSISIN